jgi:hypothetical protein
METSDPDAPRRELAELVVQFEAIEADARALAGTLSETQLNWSPDGRRWSIGQCLEHLTRTVGLYPAAIERMIEEARAREAAGRGPYREGWLSRWIVASLEPPYRLRVRTIPAVEPPGQLERERVLADFSAAWRQLAELARAAWQVDPGRARMPSPFLRLQKFTLRQIFFLNAAHGRRHLWQARQVRESPGFPPDQGRQSPAQPVAKPTPM